MIRAIFFDLDGTLVDRASAHHRYCVELMGRHPEEFPLGRREADLRFLTERSDDPRWDRRDFSQRVARRFPGLGLTALELIRDHSARLADFVEPDPEILRLIDRLSSRYHLAIVSNGSGPVQRAKLARLGLGPRTPRAFVSGELGLSKPDPRLFRMALGWASCAPDEVLFVGDDPALDIDGASSVGMATCWISGGRPYPSGFQKPGRTIGRLADLEEAR